MYAAPETISNEAMISRPPPPMARPMGLIKIVIIFQSSYKQGQRKYLEILCSSSFFKKIGDAPFERNTGNQFVTPVATFVGKLINLWISMGSVDNWSDHEGNRQYTEYQKNTSAPGNNTRMLKYLSTRQYYIGQLRIIAEEETTGKMTGAAALALTWNSIKKKTTVCIYCNGFHFPATISAGFMPNL